MMAKSGQIARYKVTFRIDPIERAQLTGEPVKLDTIQVTVDATSGLNALARAVAVVGLRDDLPKIKKVLGCQKEKTYENQN